MDKFVTRKRKDDQNSSEEEKQEKPKKQKSKDEEEEEEVEEIEDKKSKSSSNGSALPSGQPTFDEKLSVREVLALLPTGDKEAREFFDKLGNFLLNEVVLVAGGKKHAIREIEFYWVTASHNDIFTHGSKVQETCGYWYFHKTGNTYRSGSYKGLDISIGRSTDQYGGALIRSLEVLDNSGKFICGPSLSVDHIISMCGAESIPDLVDNHMKGNISVEKGDVGPVTKSPSKKKSEESDEEEEKPSKVTKPLYLERGKPSPTPLEVFKSPRVGLHPTKGQTTLKTQFEYVYRFYRYFTKPQKIPKGKNLMILALYHMGVKADEIVRRTGATAKNVAKNIELFDKGKQKKMETFAKKLTDEEVSQAIGAVSTLYTL